MRGDFHIVIIVTKMTAVISIIMVFLKCAEYVQEVLRYTQKSFHQVCFEHLSTTSNGMLLFSLMKGKPTQLLLHLLSGRLLLTLFDACRYLPWGFQSPVIKRHFNDN